VGTTEYLLAGTLLRLIGIVCRLLPLRRDTIVLATARVPILEGNLAAIHAAIVARYPDRRVVTLLEPYDYGFVGKVAYLLRLVRGMYHLSTAGLFVVDNAYLPIHLGPHRSGTTVVQVWHAVGALKRFGLDALTPPSDPERRFLHRHYDYVVCTAERSRAPWSAAFGVPLQRVLPLGTPRTDVFSDPTALEAARDRVLARIPELRGRRVVLYAPTFRGRGAEKHASADLDGRALRRALPAESILVLKTHPNLDPAATPSDGFDVVVDPTTEINDLLTATDVLITDYSSSIFEWALLRRPLVLLVADLAAYEVDPGLYLDYRTEMIGTQARDTAEVAEAVSTATVDDAAWDAFIERHLGPGLGHASERFVARFVDGPGAGKGGDTLPPDVRHV
jgi:CDP-ribitol ribitolphosphotransferase